MNTDRDFDSTKTAFLLSAEENTKYPLNEAVRKDSCMHRRDWIFLVALVFPYISIFVLFGLYGGLENTSGDTYNTVIFT
jgi:hypothetical protein